MSGVRVAVVTCSDSRATGAEDDVAGRAIMDAAEARGWLVVAYHVSPRDAECITASLMEMADVEEAELVLTIGGTGVGSRDVTPEATLKVIERMVPGLPELIRATRMQSDPSAALSRGVAGVRERTLIVNLPGSEHAALEALAAVAEQLDAAVAALAQ